MIIRMKLSIERGQGRRRRYSSKGGDERIVWRSKAGKDEGDMLPHRNYLAGRS
jgi:hypothetical protein